MPAGREATAPPERRGLARDGVRLLVAGDAGLSHRRFHELGDVLSPGDLLVLNTSRTLPAAICAEGPGGHGAPLHVSGALAADRWVVEPRRLDGVGPDRSARASDVYALPGGVRLRLVRPHPDPDARTPRLWEAELAPAVAPVGYLARHGRPIAYRHLAERPTLRDVQTVYADQPGSAEMPSAGRPFTERLLVSLMARGVLVAPVVLHAGVSSLDLGEPPPPEWFSVPATTAQLVDLTRDRGRRVVAVGTTSVRALESAADGAGWPRAAVGWTSLVLGPGRPAGVVTGIVSGLHPPEASHLRLLDAVVGPELVDRAYAEALAGPYLWHEFGDSTLLLAPR